MIATNQKKQFKCSSCGMIHPKQLGLCRGCAKFNTIEETTIAPKVYKIPTQSKKTKDAIQASKGVMTDLDKWFDFQIEYELTNGKCQCQNCNKPIRHQLLSKDTWVRRGSIAHIIPKRPIGGFPSVSTHLHNFFLACLDCHKKFDSSWDAAVKMPVFPIAKAKFNLFRNAIKEPLGKLPDELIN